jgi:hypothetical protein
MRQKQFAEMTPYRRGIEEERLRRALYRWHRYGGSYDLIIEVSDVLYATHVGASIDEVVPKKARQ